MEKEITKKYIKDELTILWKPKKCIHAAVCVKMLPEVYNPKERPWLKQENASVAELKAQINECPSGALSYIDSTEKTTISSSVKATIKPNGPMLIKGDIELTGMDGSVENRSGMTAICRCGASANKPFCDGSHAKVGFKG
ncbi:MAG: (4Fe-4S)-binding protein [Salibacteraceae bacterium]